MSDVKDDFNGVVPNYTPLTTNPIGVSSIIRSAVPTPSGGLISPPAFASVGVPLYEKAGGGGGGGVSSVSGTAGQILVANGTTTPVVSLAPLGTASTTTNPASITTDAYGRVSASTSLGYTPANPANFVPTTGGVFTGLVSGITPTADANFTTKQYVDSQIVIGGGVQSVSAGDSSITIAGTSANPTVSVSTQAGVVPGAYTNSNITVDSKGVITAVSNGSGPGDASQWATFPAVQNVDMNEKFITSTAQLDITAPEINLNQETALGASPGYTFPFPTVMNLNASGAIGITAGGAVGINAVGAVEIGAGGTIQILSTGNVSIGSGNVLGADTEIEKVAFSDNEIYKVAGSSDIVITDVNTINTVEFSSGGDITTTGDIVSTGFVAGNILKLANVAPTAEISNFQIGTDHIISLTNSTVPLADKPALLDTVFNAPGIAWTSPNLTLNAKKNDGTAVQLSTADLSSLEFFNQYKALITQNPGTTYNGITVEDSGSVYSFKCGPTLPLPDEGLTVILPSGAGVPNGTRYFITSDDDSSGPVFVRSSVGSIVELNAGGGVICVAKNTTAGDTVYAFSDSLIVKPALAKYVPLAGTLVGSPMTGTLVVDDSTNIESKNITTALITPIPTVGYVSVLGPTQVEGGNFLVANEPAVIGLASTASPAPGESASISYSFTTDDIVHINKPIEAPSVDASTTLTVDGINVKDLITFKDAKTYNVSKSGSDSTGTGSVLQPFLTVQQAITTALASGVESVVNVGPGVFTENITIGSTVGIIIQGVIQNDRCIEGTTLKGLITVNHTSVDNLNNIQVVISGCSIAGQITDISTKQHTLIVSNCRIEADAGLGEIAIQVNQTATDARTYIQDCIITQETGATGTNPLVSCNVGFLYLVRCDLTVRSLASVVSVSGSGAITNMSYCGITSDSTDATPQALVSIGSSTAKTHNIGFTTFVYASSTTKLDAPAIRFITASQTCVLGNNGFSLAGTSGRNAIAFNVGCNPILVVSNNRAIAGTANAVQSGAVISVNTYVGENAVQSISAGSGISVSGGSGTTPSISNTGVLELTAGTNITITGTKSNYTINASGGSSGVSSLNTKTGALSILAGTGISVDNTVASEITINSTSTAVVESVVEGSGIIVDNTDPANPIINIDTTGTVDLNTVNISGVGTFTNDFPDGPAVGVPSNNRQLVNKSYVDGSSVSTLNTLTGAVVLSAGTNISLGTVGNTITVNNTAPAGVSSVSGTAPIVSSGGTTPAISLSASGVVANTYAYPASLTTDTFGRITAITAGTNPSGTFLPLAGGTMSGTLNMGTQQITGASVVSTTALTLNSQPITLGQQGAGATASQNAYFTTTGGAITALASYLYLVPGAIASVPIYPAYNGENWIFPSGGASVGFTMFVNTTATANAFSLPAGFYIRFINRKALSLALTVSSVVNPLIPVGAVNTPLTLPASRDTYIYWNGTTWTAN